MSAAQDLIAAALTAAGAVRWQYPEISDELRELCARAMGEASELASLRKQLAQSEAYAEQYWVALRKIAEQEEY